MGRGGGPVQRVVINPGPIDVGIGVCADVAGEHAKAHDKCTQRRYDRPFGRQSIMLIFSLIVSQPGSKEYSIHASDYGDATMRESNVALLLYRPSSSCKIRW